MSKPDFSKLTTVEAVCNAFPERVTALLEALDLSRPGLAAVKRAVDDAKPAAACAALLDYYRNADTAKWLRAPNAQSDEEVIKSADLTLQDICTFYEQTDRVPRRSDGGLDWNYKGPTNDIEWAWALNRHYHIKWLFLAYITTGRSKYLDKLDEHLRDWVVASAPYPRVQSNTPMWRELEVGLRTEIWVPVFFGLQSKDLFAPGTRLLMLTSIPEHAHSLRYFHAGINHAVMELSGLALLSATFPEFKNSSEWMDYCKRTLCAEIERQVYPDGALKELTSHYHWVAMDYFGRFAETCKRVGEPVPQAFERTLETMHNYLAYALCPDGSNPLNNDSDRMDLRQTVLRAADRFNRRDWAFAASAGEQGDKPPSPPSRVFEWAGHLVSRSGWAREDQWSFFDIGPWGTAHQHNDKLHLSIHAYGRDLLIDSGRFSYAGDIAKRFGAEYARHSRGHNVVLIDGCGQGPGPAVVERALGSSDYLLAPAFDFARGSFSGFTDLEGEATHTRALLYVRGRYWIVVDRITTDRPRALETLWHFHPRCTVQLSDKSAYTSDVESGNLRIVSAHPEAWTVDVFSGQDQPHPQGWYSERYNLVDKAPTAVYRAKIQHSSVFAWLLVPSYCVPPKSSLQVTSEVDDIVHVRGEIGGNSFGADIPLSGKLQPVLIR